MQKRKRSSKVTHFSLCSQSASSMDSDSDSDGSHVSTTPPRHPQPPPRPPSLLSPNESEIKLAAVAAHSHPIPNPKPKPKPNPKPKSKSKQAKPPPRKDSIPSTTPIRSPDLSVLPFQIHRSNNEIHADSSTSNIPAGGLYLSKFASFSKTRRPIPNMESPEDCSAVAPGSGPPPRPTELGEAGNSTRAVKTYPNLIGGRNLYAIPVKRVKSGNEGNFVRLNINGYGSKFKSKFKSKRRRYSVSNSRRSFGRSKRTSRGLCDGDADALKVGQRPAYEKDKKVIEEAVKAVQDEASDDNLLKLLKLTHGYDSFRDGQLEAIKMVLSGQSTMLVLPTGAGKSLCYQLPGIVLPGITLVVSPLVALMIDQLKQLPPMIEGGLLSSIQTHEEMSETLKLLQEGTLKVLFVSPERFLNADFISILAVTPPISLLVVDEAHCISEWSHNFRPSYMRLRASLLRTEHNVQCILAMTATATTKTLNDVMRALEIPPTNLIKSAQLRDNLQLSITLSSNRIKDLMKLIKSSPFAEVKSIIVYCKFQSETDLISKYLCDNNVPAMSYHSGIPAKDRSRIQELFCLNKIRVVAATVAFGMGLDKSDVGAVIHYTLPESLEEYVQEIGRAGRDGRLSYCHLLFDNNTYFRLRSLMYSEGVDEYAVSRFLSQVFCSNEDLHGKICSLVREPASRKFDMKEEVMLTILTHLELGEVQYLRLLPQINVTCTLNFHQTPPALLAAKDILLSAIIKKSDTKNGHYVFDMPTVANSIGISAADVLNHLQELKSTGEISYETKDPAYCYAIVDAPKDFCSLAAHLTKWLSEVESGKVRKIDTMFNASVFAVQECKKMNGCSGSQHTSCVQKKILEYFNGDDGNDIPIKMDQSSRFLRADIKVFLRSNSQTKFTPRAVARIMHGIGSPAYPSAIWSKTHFWGRYMHVDFQVLMEASKAELMDFQR